MRYTKSRGAYENDRDAYLAKRYRETKQWIRANSPGKETGMDHEQYQKIEKAKGHEVMLALWAHERWVNTGRAEKYQRADLNGYDFRGLDLSGGIFHAISMAGADLRGCDLSGCHFDAADLRGADLRGAYTANASFERAALDGTDLHGTELLARITEKRRAEIRERLLESMKEFGYAEEAPRQDDGIARSLAAASAVANEKPEKSPLMEDALGASDEPFPW